MKMENVEDIYPLSPTQEGLLFHTLNAPRSGVYFNQYHCLLCGNLNRAAFKQAWQAVVDRHTILRTAFVWEGLDEALQVVRQRVEIPWEHQDWGGLSPVDQQTRLETFLRTDRGRGFELGGAPLMRLALIQLGQDLHQFIWSFHHLLLDGWSMRLALNEVFALYEAFCRGEKLHLKATRPYRDYIAWLQGQNLPEAETFWKQRLKGLTAPTDLKVESGKWKVEDDDDSPAALRGSYDEQQTELPETTTAALGSMARGHRLTLNTLVQGAWTLLLHRYSGENDVVFGATVSGRPADLAGVEDMVGLFINTLPVRVQVSPEASLLPWLKALQTQQVEISQYEASPLVEVQGWSEVPRGQPLFESILVFENHPVDVASPASGGLEIRDARYIEQSNYPLAVLVVPGERLQLIIIYDSTRFQAATIARMLGHLGTLLEGIAATPEGRLSDSGETEDAALCNIPLLTQGERDRLLVEWNQTQADYPKDVSIHRFFEAQAGETPNGSAVVFEGTQLTYRELNIRANQLAHRLRSLGVGPGSLVGICMERSLEMIVGMLGTLKAGGAYVPLDPTYPQERLAFMLEDTQAPVLLTQQKLADQLPKHRAHLCCVDTDWRDIAHESDENPASQASSDELAYVIYTSGSTGKPKGVMVTHRNLVHSTSARIIYYPEPVASFLLLSSFAFDSSVAGIFWTLCHGGTLVLPQQGLEQDVGQLATLIDKNQVSHTLCLPSLYRLLLTYVERRQLASLRTVIVAGEACPTDLIEHHNEVLPQTDLYNEYGITEVSVWSTVYKMPPQVVGTHIPIGRPIANTQIYLLDAYLQPVPIGVPGEMYIGGDGLTPGYLNRPDLTAEKFIRHPFSSNPEASLYKTGDLARYLPDGNIEFLGRIDQQVKIRGYRIELEEIEEALKQHPALRDAAVIARDERGEIDDSMNLEDTEGLMTQMLSLGEADADGLLAEIERLSEDEVDAILAYGDR